jgi:hypothetical protein
MTGQAGGHTLLLRAERRRRDHVPVLLRALPAIVGIANLFLLAFAERYIGSEPDMFPLMFLLFVEASGLLALAFMHYIQNIEEILTKTRIFPSSLWSRFLYALQSLLRGPSILALWGSTAVGFLILHRHEPVVLLASLASWAALSLAVVTVFLALLFWFTRNSAPATILAWIGAVAAVAIILSSLLFRFESLLEACFPIVWAARAIGDAGQKQYAPAAGHIGLLVLLSFAAMSFTRWIHAPDGQREVER